MKKVSIEKVTGLSGRPETLVRSYTRDNELTSIHLNITEVVDDTTTDATVPSGSPDGETEEKVTTYSCTLVSIVSPSHLTIEEIVQVIYRNDLWCYLKSDVLSVLKDTFEVANYEDLTAILVAAKYSMADELACHRKALLGDPTEFDQLNAFVERCKDMARAIFPRS